MSDRRLTPELLLSAYASGIFPMGDAREDPSIYWVEPRRRGIIPLAGFHLSRSLRRQLKNGTFSFEINTDFAAVIDACADREETWINATIRQLMLTLNAEGHAYSFETRDLNGALLGGMYGLAIGGAFFGESMFSAKSGGSKITLAWAVDHLSRAGFTLFDTQFITDHLRSLGAEEISRTEYLVRLRTAIELQPTPILEVPIETDPQALLQRMTQTS